MEAGAWSLQEGGYQSGYAVTTITQVVEHGRLPDHCSAQQAELYALTWALNLADGKSQHLHLLVLRLCNLAYP
jgi:hypothetical protein